MATIHYREITIVRYVGGLKTLSRQNMFYRSRCCIFTLSFWWCLWMQDL